MRRNAFGICTSVIKMGRVWDVHFSHYIQWVHITHTTCDWTFFGADKIPLALRKSPLHMTK